MENWERETFEAAVALGDETGSVRDLINLAQNLDCYDYFPGVKDNDDLGRYLVAECGCEEIPERLEPYFDYEAYGRDYRLNNGGVFTDTGFVYRHRNVEFIEHYGGRADIPEEYRVFAYPAPPERRHDLSDTKITQAMPIAGDSDVTELLNLLEANNMPGAKALLTTINQVSAMEKHFSAMVDQLAVMNQALAEAQRQNHPIKNAMQKAVTIIQGNVLDIRDKLNGIKHNIIVGCKNALAAFEARGLSALRDLTDFFKLRPGLEALQKDIDTAIRQDNNAIAAIEAASERYHKAGMHLANTGRALLGKEAIQEPKPIGNLAKAFTAPIRADRACAEAIGKCVAKAIGAVDRLKSIERKPSIKDTIEKHNREIAEAGQNAPDRSRPRPAHGERA
jgi:hypothetical protein